MWLGFIFLAQLALADKASVISQAAEDVHKKPELRYTEKNINELFWRRKDIYREIQEDRKIVVAVRKYDTKAGLIHFSVRGAGWVSASRDHAVRLAKDYEKLMQISSHFKEVKFDSKDQTLFLHMEAMGYAARMILKINWAENATRSEMQWESIWGSFTGMKGLIGFESMKAGKTEVMLEAEYEAEKLPIPKALMGLALEAVTQKVAEKMRTYIESEYRKK